MTIVCNQDNSLNEKIDKFCDIKFENSRYSVSLPLKENWPILRDNYQRSLNCLKKLKERLDKTPHLLNEYKIFNEYLKLGIIEEVQTQGDIGQVVHLPHKEVVKEDRSTTKLRIAFDASAKYKYTMSLNDASYNLVDTRRRFNVYTTSCVYWERTLFKCRFI